MVHVPIWLTLAVAIAVTTFGSYRIWLGVRAERPRDPDEPPPRGMIGGGMYRMSKRVHLLVGVVYVLLGAALVATSFGWSPLSGRNSPNTEEPSKDNAPVKPGTVPIDHPPGAKRGS